MDVTIPPVLPPEVMTMVLSNLGRKDLLNCRLVCHFWNTESLIYLKKSKYTLRLDLKRITSYVEFTKTNPKFVLPFYIDFNMDAYALNDQHAFDLPHELDKFNKNLKLLMNRFGPESIVSLNLSLTVLERDTYVDKMLILLPELFFIVSSGLKMLDLKSIGFVPRAVELLISTVKQRKINFPNLKKMKVKDPYLQTAIFQFILENSPRLENLKLKYCDTASIISAISLPLEKLKTLELVFILNPSELLMKIQERQFLPTLQKLKLVLCSNLETENKIYHDILDSFSKTLKTLTIKLFGQRPQSIKFPKFPKLQYLKIETRYPPDDMSIFLNPCDTILNPDKFPVLKCMSIPCGCFFTPELSLEPLSLNIRPSTS